jgi:HEAT repeat protein
VCQEPLVFAEVLAGLARHTAVDQDPLFASALQIEDIDVQLATLSLFAAATAPQLPEDITALAKSPNARVRRAALAAMVKAEHPGVTAHLRDATQDADLHVRIGAIEMLGQVKDREAVLLLYDLLADDQERHREAAAGALVMQQEWPAVERAAKDTSYRVRVAVAAALGKHGDPARAALAKELVRDSSAMVQAKTCESLSTWPPQIAMPILFEGLSSRNMLTRQAALAALTKQGIDAKAFNPGAPPAERATVAKALRERWQKEHPHAGAVFASTSATDGLSREEVARLIKQLQTPGDRSAQWIARKQLERLGQPVLPVLAELQRDKRITLEESTFRDLLPLISPIFVSIEQLRTADIAQRRSAARALAHEAALHPLPPFALERIGSFTRTETDPLVWADILRAASQTTDYVAHDLAMTALTKGESDVRRRACEYLTVCGDERQTEAVAKLLTDRDPVVARAALVALGRCGPPSNRQPVYALLADVDVQQQVLAAQTVARWNDPRGPAALERLALAPSIATRRLAIAAMGELADLQYTDAVLHALDDEPSVQLAALNALPKVAGVDALAEVQPAPVSAAEKARAWQAWDAKRR